MKMQRRTFLKLATLGAGAPGLLAAHAASAADTAPTFITITPKMRIGLVTYELAKDWDVDTLIRNCDAAKFEGVELRTTHKHGVEVSLSKEQRSEVRKKFKDSKVELMGLGSTCD